jgi:hypothetical protein
MKGLAASRWFLPSGMDFFANVAESLSVCQLDADDATCHICTMAYLDVDAPSNNPELVTLSLLNALPFSRKRTTVDEPLRLPCGHIFGSFCLRTWLSTNNCCPLCRCVLIGQPRQSSLGGEYAKRLAQLRQRTLRQLMKPTWSADQTVFIPLNTSSIEEHLHEFLLHITGRVRRAEFDGSFSARDSGCNEARKKESASLLNSRLLEGLSSDIPMDTQIYRQLQHMLSREARRAFRLICGRLQAMGGMEMSPAAMYGELCKPPFPCSDRRQDRAIELAVRATVEYERLTSELDAVTEDFGTY